jgi:hypothetical protein
MWTVTLHKPGRPDSTRQVRELAPIFELPVDRLNVPWPLWRWGEISPRHTGVFIEEYTLDYLDPERPHCHAVFSKLRRSPELARHFDPNRLPA